MKTILTISILFLFITFMCNAQGGNFVWAKNMGGVGDDFGYSITIDAVGNTYITGSFDGTADFDPGIGIYNLVSTGLDDIFVCKLDASGAFVWAKSMGTSSSDYGNSIAIDTNGNVYTTGYFQGTGDFDPSAGVYNLTSAGSTDIFVSKLNASGAFVWAKNMGGTNADYSNSIYVDVVGNVYTTGKFNGTADFDPGVGVFNLTDNGAGDIFISKINASGSFVWAKSMGGIGFDGGASISVDGVGNVYSTGYFNGTADFDPSVSAYTITSAGSYDIFVIKLDVSGAFVWAKSFGGLGNDRPSSISLDASGNVYTTGGFVGTADFDPSLGIYNITSTGFQDVFISKLDVSGAFIWAKGIGSNGGSDISSGNSISTDAMGNVFTLGVFQGTADLDPGVGIYTITSAGNYDIFLNKIDASGTFIWAKSIGGPSGDYSRSIAIDASSNVYTTGYFSGTVDFDPDAAVYNLSSAGGTDLFVLRLNDVNVGITEVNSFLNLVNIYPNPSVGKLFIEGSNFIEDSELKICDVLGNEMRSEKLKVEKKEINIAELSNGIYFIKLIKTNSVIFTQKFIKQ